MTGTRLIRLMSAVLMVVGVLVVPSVALADGEMADYPMVFPVAGDHYFSDTFGAARTHGRGHEGQDLMASKGTAVLAVASGTVRYVNWTSASHLNPDRCCSIVIRHDDGWESRYLHLNNDDPGTDNGQAWGIADGLAPGVRVAAGQVIGWVGDSGNAESTPPHLHFELRAPNGTLVNPFEALLLAGGNPVAPAGGPATDLLVGTEGAIREGDRGEAVLRLQTLLTELGYDVGPSDGIFGPRTAAAVLAFQTDQGLAVDGIVGPQTTRAFGTVATPSSGMLGLGSRGSAVEEVQSLLADLGYDPGPTDGIFGPRTLAAVLTFQRSRGLAVDGIVGPSTKASLGLS